MTPKLPRLAPPGIWVLAILALGVFAPLGGGAAEGGQNAPTCFGQDATIAYPDTQQVLGTPDDDVIVTSGRRQLINGREGDDLICAGGRDDVVTGADGNDKIKGQGGNDNLRGGPGDDILKGGGGKDILNGRAGNDKCFGGKGFDLASPTKCERIRNAVTRL
jgi:Ca2+-binding RTX toxin-like protein